MSSQHNTEKELKKFVRGVQKDLLFQILLKHKRGIVTKEYIQKIAEEFLSLKPYDSIDIFLEKISSKTTNYPEINDVYAKHARSYYEKVARDVLLKTSNYLKVNQINEAIVILKSVRGGEK